MHKKYVLSSVIVQTGQFVFTHLEKICIYVCLYIHIHNIHIYRKMHVITFKEEGGHEFERARYMSGLGERKTKEYQKII